MSSSQDRCSVKHNVRQGLSAKHLHSVKKPEQKWKLIGEAGVKSHEMKYSWHQLLWDNVKNCGIFATIRFPLGISDFQQIAMFLLSKVQGKWNMGVKGGDVSHGSGHDCSLWGLLAVHGMGSAEWLFRKNVFNWWSLLVSVYYFFLSKMEV